MIMSFNIDSGIYSLATGLEHLDESSFYLDAGNSLDEDKIHKYHYVASLLLILRQSAEPHLLKFALQEIFVYIEDDTLLKYFEDHEVYIPIVSVMKQLSQFLDIQQLGCQLLNKILAKSIILRLSMEQGNVYRQVMDIVNEHVSEASIQQFGMAVLGKLFASETVRQSLTVDETEEVIDMVTVALSGFRNSPNILIPAFIALKNLLGGDQNVVPSFVKKQLRLVCEILHNNTQLPEVVAEILLVFNVLVTQGHTKKLLIKENMYKTAFHCVKTHLSSVRVVQAGLSLLVSVLNDDVIRYLTIETPLLDETLTSALKKFLENESIQSSGLQLFDMTASTFFTKSVSLVTVSRWLMMIHYSSLKHLCSANVQLHACNALTKMLQCRPDSQIWIGDNTGKKQYPLHSFCLGAILQHKDNVAVFAAAAESIFWLVADNARICALMMQKNIYISIVDSMKTFMNDPRVMEAGCRALRGLCIFCKSHKSSIATYPDTLPAVTRALTNFSHKLAVQIEAICLLTCLADIDFVRHQYLVNRIHEKIIFAVVMYPRTPILLEASFEALAVLAGTESGPELLIAVEAPKYILSSMEAFMENLYIQYKGLILLQLLASDVLKPNMFHLVAEVINKVMEKFRNFPSVQAEGCIAMQLFAEHGQLQSEVLVSHGCHEHLFYVLEKYEHCTELHDLASECLYVLSFVHDLKSTMLLSACRKGMLAGVECLIELGTDVNVGEGMETPLSYACINGNEQMVYYLLQQGVSDVITPLKLSQKKEFHQIIGMLLQHVGKDKKGESLSWNNLDLSDLHPEWFIPTFGCHSFIHSDPEIGKHLAAKIKDSEKKRAIRHQYSTSDLFALQKRAGRYDCQCSFNCQCLPAKFHQTPAAHEKIMLAELEVREWKKITLTGANIPYNPSDPRQSRRDRRKLPTVDTGPWLRKGHFLSEAGQQSEAASTSKFCFCFESSPDMKSKESSACLQEKWQKILVKQMQREGLKTQQTILQLFSAKDTNYERLLMGAGNRDNVKLVTSETFIDIRCNTECAVTDSCSMMRHASLDRRSRRNSFTMVECSSYCWCTENTVKELDLSANEISTLANLNSLGPGFLKRFSYLEKLYLSKNKLLHLPSDIFKYLPRLQFLDLTSNRLTKFPAAVLTCSKLVTLELSDNKLTDNDSLGMPVSFSVKRLNMSQNNLKHFPAWLAERLPGLETLLLRSNKIDNVADKPLGLKRLVQLDLSYNSLKVIPDCFFQGCSKLETLDIISNRLEHLPGEGISNMLPRLSRLRLSDNSLAKKPPYFIPKFVKDLPNLKCLDLSRNGITELPPPALWMAANLKELQVSGNQITQFNLQQGVKNWSKSLEILNISHNKLQELPKEIGQLTSLTSLDFSYNKLLTVLPDELGRCSKLWEMPLDGLELALNETLVKGRVRDLITYLHHKLKKSQRQYRMKLMVVGYGGRGKSTLLNTLMRQKSTTSTATVGIIVRDWNYERKRYGKEVRYTISTWDFAGQEEFYSTHGCFLSNRALYLVVFDLQGDSKEIENLKPWLSNIQAGAPGCPVVIVGTHYDCLPQDKRAQIFNEKKLQIQELISKPGFPAATEIAAVDCRRENGGMEDLRNLIKKVIDGYKVRDQPVMGQKIPASYVKLSELISESARSLKIAYPVIRHNQLLTLVKKASLDLDDSELQQAVRFLNESGVLLHFDETGLHLNDFYFIDPGWLCRMMAQIVTVREINPFISEAGIMRKDNVKMLFTGQSVEGEEVAYTFPPSLIPQYLRMLEKFEIALPQNEEELLIPCRLPAMQPKLQLPLHSSQFHRYYRMPLIPIGLFSRLMTRLIAFSKSISLRLLLSLKEHQRMQCWRQGICVYWSDVTYFLLYESKGDWEEIRITVPDTIYGSRLMGELVDHVDALLDEWYPGLLVDDMYGRKLLEKYVPCPHCSGTDIHLFSLEELQEQAEVEDTIMCPGHLADVSLSSLAPDVMLSDMEPQFQLKQEQFSFQQSPDCLLGDGGFGAVYKGYYKNQPVAVKTFKLLVHPHKLLRQEWTVLRRLKHPGVVSLLAVGLRPRLLVLELAPHRSLGCLLKSGKSISRGLQHRIALQVSDGLAYLHQLMIVYRDLKPDNVLIFSLSMNSVINAKISDYGISRFATLYGLTAQEGTAGYRAPEVARRETYSFQADVFSFGILLYILMTEGKHPFHDLKYPSEMDRAITEGQLIPPFSKYNCAPWPDIQDLISHCLMRIPDQRPQSKDIWHRLNSAELFCLKQVIPISKHVTVECMALRTCSENYLELWVGSGDEDYAQLSWFSLDQKNEVKGTIFSDSRILCILAVGDNSVLVGSQSGYLWVYDAVTYTCRYAAQKLPDSLLVLECITRPEEGDTVLAGLANGTVAIFLASKLLSEPETKAKLISLGSSYGPVKCIRELGEKVYLSFGHHITVMHFSLHFYLVIEKIIDTNGSGMGTSIINSMNFVGKMLILTKRGSPCLFFWDFSKERLRESTNLAELLGLSTENARITTTSLQKNKTLWIGTGGGHIVLFDCNSFKPLVVISRYTGPLRSILSVRASGTLNYSAILCGGFGFLQRPNSEEKEQQYGCVTVWDADFLHHLKMFLENSKKREMHIEKQPKD